MEKPKAPEQFMRRRRKRIISYIQQHSSARDGYDCPLPYRIIASGYGPAAGTAGAADLC